MVLSNTSSSFPIDIAESAADSALSGRNSIAVYLAAISQVGITITYRVAGSGSQAQVLAATGSSTEETSYSVAESLPAAWT